LNDIGLSECWDAASCAATADIHSDQALARWRIIADVGSYVALSAATMTLTPAPLCLTPVLSEVIIKILRVEVGV
jgi:hypothetical protein